MQVATTVQAPMKPPREWLHAERWLAAHPAQAGLDIRRGMLGDVAGERGVSVRVAFGEVVRVGEALLDAAVWMALLDHVQAPAQDKQPLVGRGQRLGVPDECFTPARPKRPPPTTPRRLILTDF